jgi:hypothetical protein
MTTVEIGRFVAIIILVILAWNIIQAIHNALDDWCLTQFRIDEILGTTMKFS